jgi:hypothetical protein
VLEYINIQINLEDALNAAKVNHVTVEGHSTSIGLREQQLLVSCMFHAVLTLGSRHYGERL